MSKPPAGSQLEFELSDESAKQPETLHIPANVIAPFVDAATLQIRKDALRRMEAHGIFAVPGRQHRG